MEFVEASIPSGLRPYVESMVGYRIAGAPPGMHIGMPSGTDLVQHSEMLWPEGGRVMISSARPEDPHFTTPVGGSMLYVVTDDPDGVHARAESAGATFTRPMEEADYGSRGFSILDPEGNSWSFGTYAG